MPEEPGAPGGSSPGRTTPSLEFKLRLGGTGGASGASLTPPSEGSDAARPAPPRPAPSDPAAPRPLLGGAPSRPPSTPAGSDPEWEGLPAAAKADERREYKTDADVQSLINQLAQQITDDPAPAGTRPAATPDRPAGSGTTTRPSGSTPRTESRGVLTPIPSSPGPLSGSVRAVSGAATPAASARTPVVTSDAAPAAAAVQPPTPVVPGAVNQSTSPAEHSGVAVVELAAPVAEAATPASSAIADDPAAPVEVPAIVEAVPRVPTAPVAQVAPSIPARPGAPIVDRISASTEHQVVVSRAPAPQLALAPVEGKTVGPRPTKPVDFNTLFNQSGAGAGAKKKRRKRHPFRVLFKLAFVVALLGGGALAVKRFVLDTRWKGDLKAIADEVSSQRGLTWDRAIPVVDLQPGDYALRLASSMLDLKTADASTVGTEWRAMGLAQGTVELGAIGAAALAEQPAFYDPVEKKVYEVSGMSKELRELSLVRAFTNALLDQHFHWGAAVAQAGPGVRLGIRALFDGDALSIRSNVATSLLADPSVAAKVTAELTKLRQDEAPFGRGASPYAKALVGSVGAAARHLFTAETTPTPLSRDKVEQVAVTSDASIFDGVRGRSSQPDVPTAPTSTVEVPVSAEVPGASVPGVSVPGASVPAASVPAASVPPRASAPTTVAGASGIRRGSASPAITAAPTTVATSTAPAFSVPTTIAAPVSSGVITSPIRTIPVSASGTATSTSGSTPIAGNAPSATAPSTRGMIYWYYVLAGRLPSADAWHAVLGWNGDTTVTTVTAQGACVNATVAATDQTAQQSLLGALQLWAQAAPSTAETHVEAAGTTTITVHSCDPGPGADTFPHDLITPFGDSATELAIAAGMLKAGLPHTEAARSCVLSNVRYTNPPTLVSSSSIDPSLAEPTLDLTTPTVRDLMSACATQ